MLTKLTLRNFKRFPEAEIVLGQPVVFVGPNNSGKTTALQALSLWEVGLRTWLARRKGDAQPEKRPGVTINRRDLTSLPVPAANLLWHALHVRDSERTNGKQRTKNIRIEVIVDGITENREWTCGMEFDYQNEESFVCRPLRLPEYADRQVKEAQFTKIPPAAQAVRVAYLPPMSGLADREFQKQPGEIGYLIGQGQTAQVLRNLCYSVYSSDQGKQHWQEITGRMRQLFGIELQAPELDPQLSEITMSYRERGPALDVSSAGRGLQQTLLLMAYLYDRPNTVLLLDEPDAHLEVLRQRQTYQLITEIAEAHGSQVIAASHSEVVLNEAAGTATVVAFVGSPHVLNDQTSQLRKALTDIGWEQYFLAEVVGWLLCVEGPTDLEILRTFARRLNHPAAKYLERPFVHYVATNLPDRARQIFYGLREAKPDLAGIAIFDRQEKELHRGAPLVELQWTRREIENYLCSEDVLLAFARGRRPDLLSTINERAMHDSIDEFANAFKISRGIDPWSPDIKASDEVLDRLFKLYSDRLGLPLQLRKSEYHQLAEFVPLDRIDPEVVEKLDAIAETAMRATPRRDN